MASLQAKLPAVKLLSDQGYAVCEAWGLHVAGAESPSPATYVIDRDGNVVWRHLGDDTNDWPTYPQVAAALH
jgi:peroxiredoxin